MKQGEEQTKFVKEPEEPTRDYIFQKNKKTKLGAGIMVVFLVVLAIGVAISIYYFGTS